MSTKRKRSVLSIKDKQIIISRLDKGEKERENRHGIRNLSIQGEKLSAAEETVEPFLQKLKEVVEERGLIPEQIYNADETGLLWKCLPQRTLVSCREKSLLD